MTFEFRKYKVYSYSELYGTSSKIIPRNTGILVRKSLINGPLFRKFNSFDYKKCLEGKEYCQVNKQKTDDNHESSFECSDTTSLEIDSK